MRTLKSNDLLPAACLSLSLFIILLLTSDLDLSEIAIISFIAFVPTLLFGLRSRSAPSSTSHQESHSANNSMESFAELDPNPNIKINKQGIVQACNPAAERTFPRQGQSLIGASIQDLIPESRELMLSGIIESNSLLTLSTTVDSTCYQFTFLGLKERQAIHIYGMDISERRETENQLREAMCVAQATAKAKSEFLATMSHEIRTPMNGIMGMTELLIDSDLTEEQTESARAILTSAEALLSLINDILDFSKIEAGKLKLEAIEFDIRESIEEIAELFAPRIQGKGLEFPVYVEPDIPERIIGDPIRFKQVVTNLVSNAVKFTQQGEIRIHCSPIEMDDSTVSIRVDVSDTGIGIPDDRKESLFESFTQVDASTTRKYGGTGLGLSISLELAEAMSGLIAVHSKLGEGSIFAFGARFRKPLETDNENLLFEDQRDCRVLLCLSNESNQRGLRTLFVNWRCETLAVNDSDQVLELIRYGRDSNRPFHLLLLDYDAVRSNLNGFLEIVRSDTQRHRIGILLLSGVHDRKKILSTDPDIDGYLAKPVKRSQLARVTRKILDDKQKSAGELSAAAGTVRSNDSKIKSILIVEDNPINQKLATRMLEKAGHKIRIAENGRAALQLLKEDQFDLILMDCQMPVMDGFEATSEIRRGTISPQIPIIGLTANAMQGDRDECIAAGMNDYLPKPYKLAELLAKIEQWCGQAVCEQL